MYTGKLIFSQIMDFMPLHTFRRCVERYQGDYKIKSFTCLDQYPCMAFAQITYRESLRDIETCLRAQSQKIYHMGIHSNVSRSTLANANEQRDWRIYADLAHSLINKARKLYSNDNFAVELQQTVYALDATTIDLCLSMFPWANFLQHKGAIKLHTLLDLRGSIPAFIHISDGKYHEVNSLDIVPLEPGAFYVMDRGYLDFTRLYKLSQASVFFFDPRQVQSQVSQNLLPSCRPGHRRALRSVCNAYRILSGQELPGQDPSNKILRFRNRQNFRFSDQQLYITTSDYCSTLSMPLAGGTLLQMDQTKPKDQKLLWHLGECRENANLDRHLSLRDHCYFKKTAQSPRQSLHNITGFECLGFRKNANYSTTYNDKLQKGKPIFT